MPPMGRRTPLHRCRPYVSCRTARPRRPWMSCSPRRASSSAIRTGAHGAGKRVSTGARAQDHSLPVGRRQLASNLDAPLQAWGRLSAPA
jgi:hypothetical protein